MYSDFSIEITTCPYVTRRRVTTCAPQLKLWASTFSENVFTFNQSATQYTLPFIGDVPKWHCV